MVRIGLAYPHFIQQTSCNCTAMLMATLCNRPCSWATGPRRSIRKAATGTNKATDVQIVTETCPWTKTDWLPCSKHTSLSCKTNTAKQWAAQSNHSKVATLETWVPLGPLSGSLTYWVRGGPLKMNNDMVNNLDKLGHPMAFSKNPLWENMRFWFLCVTLFKYVWVIYYQ